MEESGVWVAQRSKWKTNVHQDHGRCKTWSEWNCSRGVFCWIFFLLLHLLLLFFFYFFFFGKKNASTKFNINCFYNQWTVYSLFCLVWSCFTVIYLIMIFIFYCCYQYDNVRSVFCVRLWVKDYSFRWKSNLTLCNETQNSVYFQLSYAFIS